jgi:hypothetical protein
VLLIHINTCSDFVNPQRAESSTIVAFLLDLVFNGLVKSRHPGENRSPEVLNLNWNRADSGFFRNGEKTLQDFYESTSLEEELAWEVNLCIDCL